MRIRLAALAVAVALTGGCGNLGSAAASSASDIAGASPTPAGSDTTTTDKSDASENGANGNGVNGDSADGNGDLPDPCTLLSKAEVTGLTGREVTQIDEDGGAEGARFCQRQQSGGQLAIFLVRTTPEDFALATADAEAVDGGGFWLGGHLYIRKGTIQLDVYSRGADPESGNRADARAVAETVLEKL